MTRILLIICLSTLTGCSTPIKTETATRYISLDARIDRSDIQRIIHCSYTVTSRLNNKGVWQTGIFALTENELYIYHVNPADNSLNSDLHLPFSKIRGIAKATKDEKHQIQLLGEAGVLAIELLNPGLKPATLGETDNLYRLLIQKKIPAFTSKSFIDKPYTIPLIIPIPGPSVL